MSSAKKPVRRGPRQKKEILDEQDLQKHEEFEKAVEQGRVKQQIGGDIFGTAKLQKNYFVRQQNKPQSHESQVFNFDEGTQSNPYTETNQTKQQTEGTDKGTNKKRDYRRRKKNNNIFDEQDELAMNSQIKTQQNTDAKLLGRQQQQEDNEVVKQKPIHVIQSKKLQFQKQQPQIRRQEKQQYPHQEEEQKEKVKPKQQKPTKKQQQSSSQEDQDDLKNIIKKKQQESSEEQQKVFLLHKEIQKIPKQQRKAFYYQTIPSNSVSYGYFKRFSSGLSDIYQLCGQDHRPLLFCENQRGCIGANYYISITKEMDKNNVNYLGKLRGNAAGSVYYLYDDGIQPKNQMNRSDWRVTMAAIQYENNFMGMNGPRKIKVTTPNSKLLEDADTYKLSQEQSLLNFQPPIVTRFRNKTPKWNERLKSYALNFGGRVKLASIKNFIMIDNKFQLDEEDQSDNIVVFGKVDENTFSVEFRHPLSLFQAFGIVMSEFDFKINCE